MKTVSFASVHCSGVFCSGVFFCNLACAATFIGLVGNILLATVLNGNGVLFAGIVGLIYSDLMVPPLVYINAKYYGWRVALYIAGVMFISIVCTALILDVGFSVLGILPQSVRAAAEVAQFKLDYTFYLNIIFVVLAGWLIYLHRRYLQEQGETAMGRSSRFERTIVYLLMAVLLGSLISFFVTSGASYPG